MVESENTLSRADQPSHLEDEIGRTQRPTCPRWTRIVLLVLIVAAAAATVIGALLRSRGWERDPGRIGMAGGFFLLGVACLFDTYVKLRYMRNMRALPDWMFAAELGPVPRTREGRSLPYWAAIGLMIALGVMCLAGGVAFLVSG